jgi:hypothetical protein
MNTRSRNKCLLGVQHGRRVRLTTYRHLWADCLDNGGSWTCQSYRPPRSVTGISLFFILPFTFQPRHGWGFTQPLTEMSTRKCFLGVERGRRIRLTTSPPSVSRLSRTRWSIVGLPTVWAPKPCSRIALLIGSGNRTSSWILAGRSRNPRRWQSCGAFLRC